MSALRTPAALLKGAAFDFAGTIAAFPLDQLPPRPNGPISGRDLAAALAPHPRAADYAAAFAQRRRDHPDENLTDALITAIDLHAIDWAALPSWLRQIMADRPPDASAARAITTLAAAGLQCVVVSDTASTAPRRREALAAEGLGWMELYLSSETGYEKPHPAALRRVIDDYALAPHELLMVGDLPERDVAVAQAVGSPAVLVDTHPAPRGHAQRAQRMGADVIADVAALPAYLGIPPL